MYQAETKACKDDVYVKDFKTKPNRAALTLGAFFGFVIEEFLSSVYYLMHPHPTDLSLYSFTVSCADNKKNNLTMDSQIVIHNTAMDLSEQIYLKKFTSTIFDIQQMQY